MVMGLLMLNSLLPSHTMVMIWTMALLVCVQEVMQSKYNQLCYIIHHFHNNYAQSTVDPIGVVPGYSSEIAGENSKDLVLQLPKNLTDIMLTLSDVNSIKQP